MFEVSWVLSADLWCNFIRGEFLYSENDALCQSPSEFYNFVSSVITQHVFPLTFLLLQKSLKVLFVLQLQDLAVSPAVRDPRLNTAECVIEGHKTNISAVAPIRNTFITIILWSSVCFTLVSCYLLANIFENYRKLAEPSNESYRCCCCYCCKTRPTTKNPQDQQENTENLEREEKEKFFAQAICTLCSLLALIGFLILLASFVISICYCSKGELRWDFPVSVGLIFTGTILVFLWRKNVIDGEKCCSARFTICGSVTSYLASWLLIGIMINPTWGLTVTLLLVFFLAAFTFAMYQYLIASEYKDQVAISCVFFVLAVIFLVLAVVMAGQAYYGRETTDEILKPALLSVIGALLYWFSWKKRLLALAGDSPNVPNTRSANQSNNGIEMNLLLLLQQQQHQQHQHQPLLNN